jgi:hypothetical protein
MSSFCSPIGEIRCRTNSLGETPTDATETVALPKVAKDSGKAGKDSETL